ncbi:MAG: inorganic phosphate transporter [Gammaproteobacteria bacterium]|nr:inorganic phosphate transporter [Gammaproteobacteria bacterium]
MEALAALAVPAVAWANGSNDNFKGVATLFGSSVSRYRTALILGCGATFLGALASFFISRGLLATFSGAGLVPDSVVHDPAFPLAVALAGSLTVFLATRLGLPVSTTHALIGGLLGAGWVAVGGAVRIAPLWDSVFLPLLLSPFLAAGTTWLLFLLLRPVSAAWRGARAPQAAACVCAGVTAASVVAAEGVGVMAMSGVLPAVRTGNLPGCAEGFASPPARLTFPRALDGLHYLSAGAVSFARGTNDTPKIAALLLTSAALGPGTATAVCAAAMLAGGLLNARRVAETLAHRVTRLDPEQGLLANLVTAFYVLGASRLGLPVSTTHIAVGSLFGVGAATRTGRWHTMTNIALAWLVTLPMGAALGAAVFAVLRQL